MTKPFNIFSLNVGLQLYWPDCVSCEIVFMLNLHFSWHVNRLNVSRSFTIIDRLFLRFQLYQ